MLPHHWKKRLLWFFTGLPALKTATTRGHLSTGARFRARRRAGAAEEVRFVVRGALGGAQTPENNGNPPVPDARGLLVDSGESMSRKGGCAGPGGKIDAPKLSAGPGGEIQEVSRAGAQGVTSKSTLLARG